MPVVQRLAWAQGAHHRLGSGARPSPAWRHLSADLIEMIGVAPLPSFRAWNGKTFQRWGSIGAVAAATNRHAQERRRDPSGGLITRDEFEAVYEDQGDALWRQAGAAAGPAGGGGALRLPGGPAAMAAACARGRAELRWDEATVENASKKELLLAVQAAAPNDAWLRAHGLLGKLRPLLKRTSSSHLQQHYLELRQLYESSGSAAAAAAAGGGGGLHGSEPEPEPNQAQQSETKLPPAGVISGSSEGEGAAGEAGGGGEGGGGGHGRAGPSLTREEVQVRKQLPAPHPHTHTFCTKVES
jgi:hypothetical protein